LRHRGFARLDLEHTDTDANRKLCTFIFVLCLPFPHHFAAYAYQEGISSVLADYEVWKSGVKIADHRGLTTALPWWAVAQASQRDVLDL
jgi:hypothetical protein